MNALKFLEIVTNQLLKSFSVRTKFYTSNISQFHLKREILNQIGSNNSAKFSIPFKKIPMNNDENIESDCALSIGNVRQDEESDFSLLFCLPEKLSGDF